MSPFIRVAGHDAELQLARFVHFTCSLGDHAQQGGLAGAGVSSDQQRTGVGVVQVEQDGQSIGGKSQQQGFSGQRTQLG